MLLLIVAAVVSLHPAPVGLKVEGLLEPVLALSEPHPRFAFTHGVVANSSRGLSQAGYRLQVTSMGSQSGVVWDSGRVNSSECSEIVYSGSSLAAFVQYGWSVLWLGSDGVWSATASATFEMGPISAADWGGAKYLTSSQLRYEFDTPARVTRARAHIAAAGCNVVEVNGKRPTRDFLGVCDWTVFSKRILYQTHDITDLFTTSAGMNAIGLLSGQVMRAEAGTPTLLRGIIRLEFEGDHPSMVIYTGSHWWQAKSFVTNVPKVRWVTEINWAREELGWSSPSFFPPTSPRPGWSPATTTDDGPALSTAQQMPVSTVIRQVHPVSVVKLPVQQQSETWLYTFDRMLVGTIALAPLAKAANGSTVKLLHGEWMERGVPVNSGSVQQVNHVLRANNSHSLRPVFCWHGFLYVTVSADPSTSGFTGNLDALVALEIHNDVSSTGALSFGGDGVVGGMSEHAAWVLNGINVMTLGAQLGNLAAYLPTSCPTTERQGWMGDALFAAEQGMYNFDLSAIYHSFLDSIEDNQGASGDVPYVVPGPEPGKGSCNDIAWTSAYPQLAALMYEYYGDVRVLERHYPSLRRYIENLIQFAGPAGLALCDRFGDWVSAGSCSTGYSNPPSNSPQCPVSDVVGGYSYVLALRAMGTIAGALGGNHSADHTRYATLATQARQSFHAHFYNKTAGLYGGDREAVQMLTIPALTIDAMLPEHAQVEAQVLRAVELDLANRSGYHLQVGAVTAKPLLNQLSSHGLHSAALRVATQTTEPSWGHWFSAYNATSCHEKWTSDSSRNHVFLCGGVSEWMWKHLLGIQRAAPGFSKVAIAPRVDGFFGPSSATGRYASVRGVIESAWSRSLNGSIISLQVTVPVGIDAATITVPNPFNKLQPDTQQEVVCAIGRENAASSGLCCDSSCREKCTYPKMVNMECSGGGTFSSIELASFGTPHTDKVDCAEWTVDSSCDAANSTAIVEAACLHQHRCSFAAHTELFGDPCSFIAKTLAIRATCSGGQRSSRAAHATVSESGTMLWDGIKVVGTADGVLAVHKLAGGVAFDVQSGSYSFVARISSKEGVTVGAPSA
jgi:alpha-L-rhamnosidase